MSNHEDDRRREVIVPGSDRTFGYTLGAILSGIGVFQLYLGVALWPMFTVAGVSLVGLALIVPRALHSLNVGWTHLGVLLGRVVTPLVMFVVYSIAVVPIGVLLRISGKNLLGLTRDKSQSTYWVTRTPPGPEPESLKDQF